VRWPQATTSGTRRNQARRHRKKSRKFSEGRRGRASRARRFAPTPSRVPVSTCAHRFCRLGGPWAQARRQSGASGSQQPREHSSSQGSTLQDSRAHSVAEACAVSKWSLTHVRELPLQPHGRVPPQLRIRRMDLAPALCAKRVPAARAAAAGAPHVRRRAARLAADGGRGGGAGRGCARSTRRRRGRRPRPLVLHRMIGDGWQCGGDASSRARHGSMAAEAGIRPHRRVRLAPAASAEGHVLAVGAPDVGQAAADGTELWCPSRHWHFPISGPWRRIPRDRRQ
jgi:hypothetical protein